MLHALKRLIPVAVPLGLAFGAGTGAMAQSGGDIYPVSDQPSLNFYGLPGLVDMPEAQALPDGQLVLSVSSFGGITRNTLSFQATPRITASFRYVGIQDWNSDGFETYRDRNFDVRFLLNRESRIWPAVTVGLQDFAGTGINAGEYVVASKSFATPGIGAARLPGTVRVTAGLGWGRLGSSGSIGNPFGTERPTFNPNETGGSFSVDQWFRGPAAPFGGVEWQINDTFGVKAEYSSDAYLPEAAQRGVFTRTSRFNFGAEYQYSKALRLGAYYLYGSEIGISAQLQLNPKRPVTDMRQPAPRPIQPRPSRTSDPAAYATDWAAAPSATLTLRDRLAPLLRQSGLYIEALSVTPTQAELRFLNTRYLSTTNAVGRAARAMAQVMPASVETFRIVPTSEGMALSAVTIRRSDLEALEFDPQAHDALLAVTGFGEAAPRLAGAIDGGDVYPDFSWSIGPYLNPSYFDPDEPIRADFGVKASAEYRLASGWLVGGQVRHRLAGNIGSSNRPSNSVLPRVRTNAREYARGADTYIETLYGSRQWKTGQNTYARVTAGYLESMFGGVSAELLWKPVSSRLALGAEANYVKQREFDRGFGFQDYSVATGHVSAYYELGEDYLAQLDVGRYLAGDVGATLTLTREFRNGWRIGGFMTLTDVSSEDFGEGSFDKGIAMTIPINWFLGKPTRQAASGTIRPIQRDGGARLSVPNRLYEQVRSGHRDAVAGQWSRVLQ
ncbi:YjbH domain-containing protein [Sulfitobacter sabulilitoris]|uniref:YjbH domain-containing protein n=1 Tax=Sulfitobacter sabulilitoris TaxID=2562655 RepID=A0A5S3PFE2_9RHOB|nr:YjbH domain-containing protein [Sulfitobacter sabulilitoris]TMM52709.1 YjbH domain-containing protein [Sulfitobacter sabulilitoris]